MTDTFGLQELAERRQEQRRRVLEETEDWSREALVHCLLGWMPVDHIDNLIRALEDDR